MTNSNRLNPARVVLRAGTVGTSTDVIFEINRPLLWACDNPFTLKRGSFRTDQSFLCVEEPVRALVFALLQDPENLAVYALRFTMSSVELRLISSAAGDLNIYVARMRELLAEIFGLDETVATYLVIDKFGPPANTSATTHAISAGWGGNITSVADNDALAVAIRAERTPTAAS